MTLRIRFSIRGQVQGVGFRPFVYRLAKECALSGFVRNDSRGVVVEIEGPATKTQEFERRLSRDLRLPARIDELTIEQLPRAFDLDFVILPSSSLGTKETTVLADIAPCAECVMELFEPSNRRYRYPFTNCTHCGPRFTIIQSVPYDRPNTTMSGFLQCANCQAEYDSPSSRRFHAQPNACPDCGPKLQLLNEAGKVVAERDDALAAAEQAIRLGQIVAVQGVGGFQLVCDARSDRSVSCLRSRKHRWEKPLAVMVANLNAAQTLATLDSTEQALLVSPEAPIVLVSRRADAPLSELLAPGNPRIGLMLPSSPLHHLLLVDLGFPVVATSGNLSEEPIAISPEEAVEHLYGIANAFLVHNRPIERHADDSVVTVNAGDPQILRRARGFAPLPIPLHRKEPVVLALGGHLKNTVALSIGDRCFLSQHIGDLDNLETRQAHLRVVSDLLKLYETRPVAIAHDLHDDYASSQIAEQLTAPGGLLEGVRRIKVQHHHAHLAACLAESGTTEPVLGVIWDGSGLGTDQTIWGGEFLFGNADGFERIAGLLPFRLPGGDKSAKSPRRIALSLMLQHFSLDWLRSLGLTCALDTKEPELSLIQEQISKKLLAPKTSSMGRLFDAVSSLAGLVQEATFEGQAAMALEFIASPDVHGSYPLILEERTLASSLVASAHPLGPAAEERTVTESSPRGPGISHTGAENATSTPRFCLDPRELLEAVALDVSHGVAQSVISARFHAGLVESVTEMARRVGVGTVALSGGCFQNRLLSEQCRSALSRLGHKVLVHHQVPPNDGGLALGQAAVACSVLAKS